VFGIHGPDRLKDVINVEYGPFFGGDFRVSLDALFLEVTGNFSLEQNDVVEVLINLNVLFLLFLPLVK
jgi:hypothetical protein